MTAWRSLVYSLSSRRCPPLRLPRWSHRGMQTMMSLPSSQESNHEKFVTQLGQTTPFPVSIEVDRAEGLYIYDKQQKRYMDMVSGVAVNNIGHSHPHVVQAIKDQLDRHMHVMVYGEYIQDAQLRFSDTLRGLLPPALNCVYPVNSGTEANEAALKLAKRVTGRRELVAFRGAYHGATHGSMSISSSAIKARTAAFEPLLPEVRFLDFNDEAGLDQITEQTAGVITETIQSDAGVRVPDAAFLQKLRARCTEVGALLIFDEIQCGMGRTGRLCAFERFGVVPDALTLGKALGGGMPVGALVSSTEHLTKFTFEPMLGHITTFGGHPVICAAANATLEVMARDIDFAEVERLGQLLEDLLTQDEEVREVRRLGLMFACDMATPERVTEVVKKCIEKGLLAFYFLSLPNSFRLSPPLNITEGQIREAGEIILQAIAETKQ
uniref:Acetylornithine transaminase n=1 Tax=Eutreptiella gymnastica TaxID=73025 RepID=A0A7S4GNH0_9EUGL